MKHIVYERPDGGVTVVSPAPAFINELMAGDMDPARMVQIFNALNKEKFTAEKRSDFAVAMRGSGMSEDMALELLSMKDVPANAVAAKVIENLTVSTKRTFRNAWKLAGDKIVIDMPKAREIKLAEIRKERNAKLDALDKEFMKALSTKKDTKALEDKMQALRDIPQTTDLSSIASPEALEAFQPEWPL